MGMACFLAYSSCSKALRRRLWFQLSAFSEVLNGGGEQELVSGAVRSAQAKAAHPEDAFEMGKQHLDTFALPPRLFVFW